MLNCLFIKASQVRRLERRAKHEALPDVVTAPLGSRSSRRPFDLGAESKVKSKQIQVLDRVSPTLGSPSQGGGTESAACQKGGTAVARDHVGSRRPPCTLFT